MKVHFSESNYTFALQKAKIITKLHLKNVTRQVNLHPVWKFLDPPLIAPHQKFMAGSITDSAKKLIQLRYMLKHFVNYFLIATAS